MSARLCVRWLPAIMFAGLLLGACGNESRTNNLAAPTAAVGAAVGVIQGASAVATARSATIDRSQRRRTAEIDARFKQAAAMLHIKQYKYAATALHRVLELAPNMPEAHVNMGFAMLGMERCGEARNSFKEAIHLKSAQANAYFGLAEALYCLGDREAAIDAMNRYMQLSRPEEPYVSKARAMLSKWRQAAHHESDTQPGKMQIDSPGGNKPPIDNFEKGL